MNEWKYLIDNFLNYNLYWIDPLAVKGAKPFEIEISKCLPYVYIGTYVYLFDRYASFLYGLFIKYLTQTITDYVVV